jgi:hypothetical protein
VTRFPSTRGTGAGSRVRGALALLVDRALEKELQAASSGLSLPAAWQALETIRCVEVGLGSGHKLCVTRGSQHAASMLRALRITELDPPRPARGEICASLVSLSPI